MHAKTKRLEIFERIERTEKIERLLWRTVDAAGQLATRVVRANRVGRMLDIDLGSNCVGFGVMIEPNG